MTKPLKIACLLYFNIISYNKDRNSQMKGKSNQMIIPQAPSVKVVLLGDSGVGKTSIVSYFVTGKYPLKIPPTVGAAFITKKIHTEKGGYELLIWDTSGEEAYRSLAPMYYRSASIAIVVCDVSQPETISSAVYWFDELKNNLGRNIVLALCGNKLDLVKDEFKAKNEAELEKVAADFDGVYITTSAIDGYNIDRLFQLVIDKYENEFAQKQPINRSMVITESSNDSQCC
ncbi:Vacuolar protein sorting-associated protein 21 [Tritrichomonas foetus]|uniref:Vacuolar protein sorting-associated protein 21 n=1 Tax=Tritrichomonas foetus TaxID=1144522 RepID=A0A1J4KD07_9EUKA|nr:Vacuolar protein sorting-associated protein 21 [Tritrichomonas foetus]|eukprot:OHT08858.1 Vacuolar protein sorting-associated protein 21 [Tritrichomonas foetus]